jgi:hypothetical protein
MTKLVPCPICNGDATSGRFQSDYVFVGCPSCQLYLLESMYTKRVPKSIKIATERKQLSFRETDKLYVARAINIASKRWNKQEEKVK